MCDNLQNFSCEIQGVHKLSLQFQKFIIVLFFKMFLIGLFYSNGEMLQVYVRCFSTMVLNLVQQKFLVVHREFHKFLIKCS